MKNKHDIEKYCKYCEKASALHDTDTMLRATNGILHASQKCRSFRSDPLKREPKIKKSPDALEYVEV